MYRLLLLGMVAAATPVAAQQRPMKNEPPVPPGATLHFKDTVSATKRPDGSCDWARLKLRTGQPRTSSYLAAQDDSTCTGVVYNVTFPRFSPPPTQVDSETIFMPRLPFEPPPPQLGGSDSAIVVNLVRLQLARPASPPVVQFGDVTVRGDSASVTVWHTDTEGQRYWLEKRNGMWELASRYGPIRR